MATGSTEFLDALVESGVTYIFANLGSDHPGLVEALAEAAAHGRYAPRLITCPTEMVALSAAHGFAQVSGVAQAVVVHVDCGTQSLAGAIHNAAKGRVPVLIFAGASPYTQRGELKGGRNEFIHWIQDAFDQRGLVRGYTKYDNEFRTAENIKEITHRALRFAYSDPKGPVYLVGPREVMEETVESKTRQPTLSNPIFPSALTDAAVDLIVSDLLRAHRPLIITSYIGRNKKAVAELYELSTKLGIGVLESVPNYVNFPHHNDMYQGNQWNGSCQNPILADADAILVIDSDVPWVPLISRPAEGATIYHIDVDPIKQQMPLSAITGAHAFQVDAETALRQINVRVATSRMDAEVVAERRAHYTKLHRVRGLALRNSEKPDNKIITPEYLTAKIRGFVDNDTIVINEGISNYHTIIDHLAMNRPEGMFTSGGGSLGWNGGAAIGAKLAHPEKTIIALTGDGAYMLSIPSSVHWMARRYKTPFLQIIYNNGGWKSPKISMLAIHPDGYASKSNKIGVEFTEPPDYPAIATAAGGAFGRTVRHADEVEDALKAALHAVRAEQRAAVLDVHLASL